MSIGVSVCACVCVGVCVCGARAMSCRLGVFFLHITFEKRQMAVIAGADAGSAALEAIARCVRRDGGMRVIR